MPKIRKWDEVGFIMDFESGNASGKDIIDGFAHLVASGHAWSLQGMYGRTASALIEQGYISKAGKVLKYPEGV